MACVHFGTRSKLRIFKQVGSFRQPQKIAITTPSMEEYRTFRFVKTKQQNNFRSGVIDRVRLRIFKFFYILFRQTRIFFYLYVNM